MNASTSSSASVLLSGDLDVVSNTESLEKLLKLFDKVNPSEDPITQLSAIWAAQHANMHWSKPSKDTAIVAPKIFDPLFRQALRIELLRRHLFNDPVKVPSHRNSLQINDFPVPLVLEGNFSGEGDSGSYHNDVGLDLVDEFFAHLIDQHANFDWYNNEGGGGSVVWDLANDVIEITGYYNEIQRHSCFEETL